MQAEGKLAELKENLAALEQLVLGYSGGTDSTFLMAVAHQVLGKRLIAATLFSPLVSAKEQAECLEIARDLGIEPHLLEVDPLKIPGFSDNPPDRCYICKHHLFSRIWELARSEGIAHVADGTNLDDLNDYRPGLLALQELGVRSPLLEVGMGKEDIRYLSRELGLPTWNKPAAACLASRFPYGQTIDREGLARVEQAEALLQEAGFKQVRVRVHHDLARIEIPPTERTNITDTSLMDSINRQLQQLGFKYVCLDLQGYRTGSLNV